MNSVESSVKIVRPQGALTATNADTFKQEILRAITSEHYHEIAIDMAAVNSVDHAGLVALLAGYDRAKRYRKRLSLFHVVPQVRIVLELAQLDRAVAMVDGSELRAA